MKRPIAFALIAAAVLGAGTTLALAQGGFGHGDRMMHRMDLNGDGGITRAEADAMSAVRFLRLDSDADGVLTEQEMRDSMQRRMVRRIAKQFAMMDQNGDGRIERAEFEEGTAARFARRDADGDRRISNEELRARHHEGRRGRHGDTLRGE